MWPFLGSSLIPRSHVQPPDGLLQPLSFLQRQNWKDEKLYRMHASFDATGFVPSRLNLVGSQISQQNSTNRLTCSVSPYWNNFQQHQVRLEIERRKNIEKYIKLKTSSCRLIVAQMSNTNSETFHWMTPVLAVCFVVSLIIPSIERILLYAFLVGSSLTHWHYGTVVVQQLCQHFDRVCFGVGKRTAEPKLN